MQRYNILRLTNIKFHIDRSNKAVPTSSSFFIYQYEEALLDICYVQNKCVFIYHNTLMSILISEIYLKIQ